MRLDKIFTKRLHAIPSDADTNGHQIALRGGYIYQTGAGVYTFTSLGLKVLRNIENLIRSEMDKLGCQEILMPITSPANLWKESNRYDSVDILLKFKNRAENDFVLNPTHEEIVTDYVRSCLQSYKQLPFSLYQIQTKYRDELRVRAGLIRCREFIMKDAYSFDVDEKGLEASYQNMYETYKRIFDRLGINYKIVLADTGAIGGNGSHQFMALSDVGESTIVYCDNCHYAADEEKATSIASVRYEKEEFKDVEEVLTENKHTIEEISEFLNVPAGKTVKTMIYYAEDNKTFGAFLVRGDYEVNEIKVANALNSSEAFIRLATDEEILSLGSVQGFIGPVNLNKDVKIFVDNEVKELTNFVVGANKKNYHLINVNFQRDFDGVVGDYKKAKAGDLCPVCHQPLKSERGIEVGQIFKLQTKYSLPMNCVYLNEQGRSLPMVMGCYGIGVTRTFQAMIEQHHDDDGIVFPLQVAPYHAVIVPVNYNDEAQKALAESIYEKLSSQHVETVLDDRLLKIGFKLKDWELIGIPNIIIVGRRASENIIEYKDRKINDKVEMSSDEVVEKIVNLVKAL